jgi:tRNA threonylcarbamoyladenosine modification (KEOPS) complex  Pcc1 subunit
MGEERELSVLFLALKPECKDGGRGFSVEITIDREKLIIKLSAKSLSRLRAVLNSYLRWIKSIFEAVEGGVDATANPTRSTTQDNAITRATGKD